MDSITRAILTPIACLTDGRSCGAWIILGDISEDIGWLCNIGAGKLMWDCVGIEEGIGAATGDGGACAAPIDLSIADGVG